MVNCSAETIISRKSDRRHSARGTACGAPGSEIAFGPHPASLAAERPAQPFARAERSRIRQPAVAVALQSDALAAAELGQLGEREHQQLAILPDDRDRVGAV